MQDGPIHNIKAVIIIVCRISVKINKLPELLQLCKIIHNYIGSFYS